jgi:hypothetical protein
MRFISVCLLSFSAIIISACNRIPDNIVDRAQARLPDLATMYLQSAADELAEQVANGQQQSVCASTEAFDRVSARVEVYNEALQERIELLQALAAEAEALETNELTVTRGQFSATLTIEATEETVTYTVAVSGPDVDNLTILEGTAAVDLSEGTWTVFDRDGEERVNVEWTNADDTLTVTRTAQSPVGERTAVYTRTPTTVTLDFAGPDHDAHAEWDRTTHDGSITVDGEDRCWDADVENDEICEIECDAVDGE